jgi:very-short-patch-repair endonuclease
MHRFPPSRHRALVLASRASALREFSTISERRLWQELSAGRVRGVRFRQQVVVGPFIADFLAPAIRLIVEVDGPIHERTARADARRDEKLRRLGYRVLRVEARLVIHELPVVLARVREAIGELRRAAYGLGLGSASSRVVLTARWRRPSADWIEAFCPLRAERPASESASMRVMNSDGSR